MNARVRTPLGTLGMAALAIVILQRLGHGVLASPPNGETARPLVGDNGSLWVTWMSPECAMSCQTAGCSSTT